VIIKSNRMKNSFFCDSFISESEMDFRLVLVKHNLTKTPQRGKGDARPYTSKGCGITRNDTSEEKF